MCAWRSAAAIALAGASAIGLAAEGRWTVNARLDSQRVQTTVDSELAQYCLEQYLQARRTQPAFDRQLDNARMTLVRAGWSPLRLRELSQQTSPDTVAALFAGQLLEDARNRAFRLQYEQQLQRLAAARPAAVPRKAGDGSLLLMVPGWLYQSNPQTGADFARPRRVLEQLGLRSELAPMRESGTIEENAAILAGEILRHSAAQADLILVSASKAGPETGEALSLLERSGRRHRVRAWVNIGGILQGSPLADWASRGPQRFLVAAMAPFKGWTLASVESMRTQQNRERFGRWRLPPGLLVVNFVGIPFSGDITKDADFGYRRILAGGPNDGLTLLPQALVPDGLTLAQLGLDHYFRDPQIDLKTVALARAVLQYTGEQGHE